MNIATDSLISTRPSVNSFCRVFRSSGGRLCAQHVRCTWGSRLGAPLAHIGITFTRFDSNTRSLFDDQSVYI